MNHLSLIVASLFLVAPIAFVSCSSPIVVELTSIYPDSSLPAGLQAVWLAGSPPLSWDSPVTMSNTWTNTYTASFEVEPDLLNATYPVLEIDIKIVLDVLGQPVWQLGCNDRLTLTAAEAKHNGGVFRFTVYPYFYTSTGQTTTISNVYSPQLNNTRDVWVYVPPAMVENTLRRQDHVLVMHDGQNLSPLWKVDGIVDQLIQEGKMVNVLIIGPYNTPDRIAEYTYSVDPQYGGGKGDLYLDFLQDTLIPSMQTRWNFSTSPTSMGIMGSSLGGLISCYAGVTRPSVYSKAGCMSSSFWWNSGDFYRTILPRLSQTNLQTQTYYIDSGDSGDTDDDRPDTTMVSSGFAQFGFQLGSNLFWYLQRGGQHNEAYWSERFHHPMQWMYYRDALWNDQ